MSIRIKLIIMFLAVALIPVALISLLTFNNYKNSLEVTRIANLKNLAAFKAEKIESYFHRLTTDLELLQNTYIVKKNLPLLSAYFTEPASPEFLGAKAMLDGVLPRSAEIVKVTDIKLISPAGKIVYSVRPEYRSKEDFDRIAPLYKEAFARGKDKIYFSDVFSDQARNNRLTMLITYPVTAENGAFCGVIAFEVGVEGIYDLIQDVTGLGSTGETLIGKKTGNRVIFLNSLRHESKAALARQIDIGSKVAFGIQEAAQGRMGAGEYLDYRGEKVIGAWRYIPSLGWGLVAKMDSVEALSDAINLRKLILMVLLIISGLAGIVAFSLAQSIALPIKKLAKGAEIVGWGNLEHKIALSSRDEFGQLARAFDKMTEDLSKSLESLRQSSQYARNLIETSLDPLVTISTEGKITDVNEATIKATGLSREKLVGTDFSDYFTEPEKAREGYGEVFEKGYVIDYPLTIRHKSGKLIEVLYNASVYKDTFGKVIGVFAAARDVTAQKQSSRYARSLIETSLDPLITISAEGKITDVNEATIKATGLSREKLVGTDFSDYFTEPEKAREGYHQVFEKGFVIDYPLTIRHENGRLMDVLYNASVYKDAGGNVLGVFAAARDVTVQKQTAAELKRHRDNLEELVRSRTLELEISNNRLARSNENLEQFAYVASHDLQEPLRIMASYSQLLERRYKDKLDKDANDFIDFIVDAAKRMQRLITDLLAYSRLRHSDAPMAESDCNKLLARVIESMALTIRESGAEVTYDELPKIRGYEINLMQLFQNLIGNAIKFHGPEKPRIHISAGKSGAEWVFSVKDNGIGIDPQYREKIFLIFQRLHGKDEYPGTGIGLAICKKIIDNHGGRIWVESVLNQGSVFYFTIPATKGGMNG